MEHRKTSTEVAGIDISNKHLDAAVHGGDEMRFANDAEGFASLAAWLGHGVRRVGLEATGGYEKGSAASCRPAASRPSCISRSKCVCSRASSASAPRATDATPA